ncbi:hypothetical protein SAMN05444398_103195 [Roseovarius pacificus]|uniref:Uncharacterized protein n=1 Tax=Roseovarius pacificus TaxID=337701 RepID=A0A1M7BE94_9RHOB|nr:hypothetical protein SAMN05444398_103195 [Roseovarius pacificus]
MAGAVEGPGVGGAASAGTFGNREKGRYLPALSPFQARSSLGEPITT